MTDFLERFDRIAQERRWQLSPAGFIDAWEQTVAGFETGYTTFGLDEFQFDLQVRRSIEEMLTHPDLQGSTELMEIRRRVELTDSRFREITQPIPSRASHAWWADRVLLRGGDEYADDAERTYGVEINRIDARS